MAQNWKWKKEIRRAVCALLTAAMLCSDAGLAVYAAEPEKQDALAGITEETMQEEAQVQEAPSTEASEPKKDASEAPESGEPQKDAGEDSESGEIQKDTGGGVSGAGEITESTVETPETGETPETDETAQTLPEETDTAAVPEEPLAAAVARTFEVDYIIYEVISEQDHTVRVKGMNRYPFNRLQMYDEQECPLPAKPVDLTIPAEVASGDVTWKVTEIGEFAFADYRFDEYNKPGNANWADTPIGDSLLTYNIQVSRVIVSPGITKIGKGAFYRTVLIGEVVLPETVVEIGEGAFYVDEKEHYNLVKHAEIFGYGRVPGPIKANIPASVKKIGDYAYYGVFFNGTLRIPGGVEEIGEYAFACESKASGIYTVSIPASVKKIHRWAFDNATLTAAALYQPNVQLTEYLDGSTDIEYATWMFGHRLNVQSYKELTLFVPESLMETYQSSTLPNFFTKLAVKNINEYREEIRDEQELKASPLRFICGNYLTNLIEIPRPNVSVTIQIDKGEAAFGFEDIAWSFRFQGREETLTAGQLAKCLSYEVDAGGTMQLTLLRADYYEAIAKVDGYYPFIIYINNPCGARIDPETAPDNPGEVPDDPGDNPDDPGDTPGGPGSGPGGTLTGGNQAFLDKVNAFTVADIAEMKKLSYAPEIAFQLEEIKAMAEKITANAASDRDKILAVHTWLAEHIAYDYATFGYDTRGLIYPDWVMEDDESPFMTCPLTPYDVLKNRYTVCDGYARLAEDMLRSIGIPCAYIGGSVYDKDLNGRTGHAWNMAYDGQKWIYFDATWDASGSVSAETIKSAGALEGDVPWFDFDVDRAMKQGRDFEYVNFAEKSVSGGMVKSSYLTLFPGEEGQFQALSGYTDVTFRLDDGFADTEQISLDTNGHVTAKKPGLVQVRIEGKGADGTLRTEAGYVRILAKNSFAFKKAKMEVEAEETEWKVFCLLNKLEVQLFAELTSSNPDVVAVKEDGTLVPKKAGTAVIKAKLVITAAEKKPEISCAITVLEKRPTLDYELFKYRILSEPTGSNPGTVEITGHNLGKQGQAFWDEVVIPEEVYRDGKSYTVIGIGKGAFAKAEDFENVKDGVIHTEKLVLPDTLQYIEEYAFCYFTALQHPYSFGGMSTIDFPASLQRIEEGAFGGQAFTSIVFPEGSQLRYIGDSAFPGGPFSPLKKVDLSNCSQLREIGESAFSGHGNPSDAAERPEEEKLFLREVKLPEGLKTIGAEAFYWNQQLTSINLPSTLESIGDGAFRFTGLTSIQIPSAVKSIGEYAFMETPLIGTVDLSGVPAIGAGAFRMTKIETAILPDALQKIPDEIFSNARSLKNVLPKSYLAEIGGVGNLSGGIFKLPASAEAIGSCAFLYTALTGTLDLSGVSAIGSQAFCYTAGIEKIILSDALTEISDGAFDDIKQLKTLGSKSLLEDGNTVNRQEGAILLSEKITKIGESGFESLPNIETIQAPGVKKLGKRAFAVCPKLKEVILSDELTVIPKQAFFYCEALDVAAPGIQKLLKSAKTIEKAAFSSTGLTGTVDISGVSKIEKAIFEGSRKIETVILPDELTEIPEKTFSAMDVLQNVVSKSRLEELNAADANKGGILLSDRVAKIGASAFEGCLMIGSLDAPGLEELGDQAFFRCEKLGSATDGAIELGRKLKTIGTKAFFLCDGLKKVTIYSTVMESVGEACFYLPSAPDVYIYKDKLPSGIYWALKSSVNNIIDMGVPNDNPDDPKEDPDDPKDDPKDDPDPANRIDISKLQFVFADAAYTGAQIRPADGTIITQNASGGSLALKEDKDYQTLYENNVNAGTASVIVVGIGEYTGSKKLAYKILPRKLEGDQESGYAAADIVFEETAFYTGKAVTPAVTVAAVIDASRTNTLELGKDYTIKYTNNIKRYTNSGSQNAANRPAVTITGKGNYKGKITGYFDIAPISIKNVELVPIQDQKSADIRPVPVLKYQGKALKNNTDFTLDYNPQTDPQTGKITVAVTITGKNNFGESRTESFGVADALISDKNVRITVKNTVYTGIAESSKPEITVTFKNGTEPLLLAEGVNYEVAYDPDLDAGKKSVTVMGIGSIEGIGSFGGRKTISYKMTAKDINAKLENAAADVECKTNYEGIDFFYTGNAVKPAVVLVDNTVIENGAPKVLAENTDYTLKYSGNTNVTAKKPAVITIVGKGNYKGTYSVKPEFQIAAWNLKAELEKENGKARCDDIADQDYAGKALKPAVVIKVTQPDGREEVLKNNTAYKAVYRNNTNAADKEAAVPPIAAIIPNKKKGMAASDNEEIVRTFTIRPLNLADAVIKKIPDQTLKGTPVRPAAPTPSVKIGKLTLKKEEGDIVVIYENNSKKGVASLTIKPGNGNYTGEKTAEYLIK